MVPVMPCIFEQAIQRDFVHLENLVSGEDIYSDRHPHKMPSQSSGCHRYCQMSHDTQQCLDASKSSANRLPIELLFFP